MVGIILMLGSINLIHAQNATTVKKETSTVTKAKATIVSKDGATIATTTTAKKDTTVKKTTATIVQATSTKKDSANVVQTTNTKKDSSKVDEGQSIIYTKNAVGKDTFYVIPTGSINQLFPGCPCFTIYDNAVKSMTAKDGTVLKYNERVLRSKVTNKPVGTRRFAVFVGKDKPKGEAPVEEILQIDKVLLH